MRCYYEGVVVSKEGVAMSMVLSFRNTRFRQRLPWAIWYALLIVGLTKANGAEPLFFIQLSDPQFGMYAQNANFQQETVNFEFAIATANRLKPAFVIVTGDLVNEASERAQADEYLRIAAKLDRSIPLYQLPGNHDAGNDPTPESIAGYMARFGPDHYSFRCGPIVGLVLDSSLIHSSKGAPKHTEQQEVWLKAELEKAKREGARHVIVFQHHPWFVESIDEPDGYHNLPRQERRRFLDLFQEHGVTHIFAGHNHANGTVKYGSLEIVTSGAIGKPLRKDVSGLRIVILRDTGVEHHFYHLGEIPNRIDLAPPKKAAAKASR
jgi:serine/threonine-protein phosphatase CPPED1